MHVMLGRRSFSVALLALAITSRAQDPPPPAAADPLMREIRVPLHEGRLDVGELVQVLFEAYGFDAEPLDLPDTRVDLRGARGWLLLGGCRKLLRDTVRLRRDPDGDSLIVVVDRVRARTLRRELRAGVVKLVARLTGQELDERRFELALPSPLDPARPLVVLVHGVESSPEVFDELRAALAADGTQLATFAWPNDESCERSAAELARALGALKDQRLRIVGHSAGGLIARAMLENERLDPGNVEMLIQIGAPNRGSKLAGLRFALELDDLLGAGADRDGFARALLAGMRANLIDGLGEAGGDLLPGSVFLERLARGARNPRVRYRLVLGTRSLLSAEQLAELRGRADTLLDSSRASRVLRTKLVAWLEALDELIDGRGDGAVAIERGSLEGVQPVFVPLDHVGLLRTKGLLGRIEDAHAHPVFTQVRAWLAEK